MDNHDIDAFFHETGLAARVDRQIQPPSAMWVLQAGNFPVLIQTQEDADRIRIVAFIADADSLPPEALRVMLEANYHTAMDARYAITGEHVVAAFLHPLEDLTDEQFVLGFYQVVSCAETFGTHFSGGTMVFGHAEDDDDLDGLDVVGVSSFRDELVAKILASQQQ